MPTRVRASRRGLTVRDSEAATIDLLFDGHRVWSTRLPPAHPRTGARRLRWPDAMAPYLNGETALTMRDSATGQDVATTRARFGGSGRVSFTDAQGRWLAMDKWNRLGPSFDGASGDVQGRLLASSATLAEQMQSWGYPIFIVGGTLLGAMRTGELLPHDDDSDFAFWCDKSDVQDVSLVTFELERQLAAVGYTVVRHSHAHLELVFFDDSGSIDYYIDVFAGYHSEEGPYNQPFALRGPLPLEELLPVSTIEVGGVQLPAPAVPESWLVFAYGPSWRVPDPSFVWETPRSTLRRFENSFGVFNRQRVFWEKTWQRVDKREPARPDDGEDVALLLRLLPEHALVVDLGCGDGRDCELIAAAGHEVIGVDYSLEALRVARQTQPAGVDYRFLNLNDRHAVLRLGLELIEQGRQPYFYARNLLQCMRALGRADLFTTLRGVLDAQTFLLATFDAVPEVEIDSVDPQTWSLDVGTLRREAWRWKLGLTVLDDRIRLTPVGERTNISALLWA